MTAKRFYVAESNLIDGYCVFDREKKYAFSPKPREADCLNDAHTLNELYEENEQLKSFKSRVFNLLQDEIREESELLDYYLKEKALCNADRQQVIIGVLKRLQKELLK